MLPPDYPKAIRQLDLETGNEYWSARDLMPLLGYNTNKWDTFMPAVERARLSIEVQGIDAGQHIGAYQYAYKAKAGFGERTYTREDFRLTRYGAYHVALSGDPRKPEVAAAIRYFVVKTREAEIVQQEIPQTYAAALQAAADEASLSTPTFGPPSSTESRGSWQQMCAEYWITPTRR